MLKPKITLLSGGCPAEELVLLTATPREGETEEQFQEQFVPLHV